MCSIISHTHQTAPTQFVEANIIRFSYRRFGNPRGVPVVLNQHFKGTLDYGDPAVTDGLAKRGKSSCSTTLTSPRGIGNPRRRRQRDRHIVEHRRGCAAKYRSSSSWRPG